MVAESLDEALAAVNWYAERGYHEIKTYNSMRVEWVEPIVAEARKAGLGVSGHVPAFMSPDAVIAAGYDSIAHINQLMLGWLLEPGEDTRTALRLTAMKRAADLDLDSEKVRETIRLMRENGTALDTTAVIFERLMISRARQVHAGNAPYLDHVPIGYQRYRRRTFVPLLQRGDDEQYVKAFDKSIEVIGLLHESGVPLLIGTDDATGFTIHRELELYVQAGIPPGETLAIANAGRGEIPQPAGRTRQHRARQAGGFPAGGGQPRGRYQRDAPRSTGIERRRDLFSRRNIRESRRSPLRGQARGQAADGRRPLSIRFPQAGLSCAALLCAAVSALAQPSAGWFEPTRVDDAPAAPWVRTHHSGVFDGRAVEYDAITGETVLPGEDGQPAATIFSTAYVRTDIETGAARPIVFFFNGGPGASSSPLHLGVGPVRVPRSGDDPGIAPNPSSPLDAVDMVFVDPVGTGYARVYEEGAGAAFWGIEEDADANLFFVRDWLARQETQRFPRIAHGRELWRDARGNDARARREY